MTDILNDPFNSWYMVLLYVPTAVSLSVVIWAELTAPKVQEIRKREL